MNIDISVPEVVELFKEIQIAPEKLFEMMRLDIQQIAGDYLNALMESELSIYLNRDRYERCGEDVNHRNGYYPRKFTIKGIGNVDVKVPRDRKGLYSTSILPKRNQYEDAVAQDLSIMFLAGISTRRVGEVLQPILGQPISPEAVSRVARSLDAEVRRYQSRRLADTYRYVLLDGNILFRYRKQT